VRDYAGRELKLMVAASQQKRAQTEDGSGERPAGRLVAGCWWEW
jgi:hypothetical protein